MPAPGMFSAYNMLIKQYLLIGPCFFTLIDNVYSFKLMVFWGARDASVGYSAYRPKREFLSSISSHQTEGNK